MPRYFSDRGEWHPVKEKVGLVHRGTEAIEVDGKVVNPGEPYIYEGPDRAALFELWKAGVEKFGENFKNNPEFLQSMRNQGYDSVPKFLKAMGYDEKKATEDFTEKASVINKHELPAKVKMVETLGGGQDFSGQGKDIPGGFGEAPKI